jgi:serine/threonine-protein kinase
MTASKTTTKVYRKPKHLGPYHSLKKLGRGAMNYVLRGVHHETGQVVALKVLAPHQRRRSSNVTRWQAESQAGLVIRHDHVVAVLDVGEDQGWAYLAQELVLGGDLSEFRQAAGGRLPPAQVIRLGMAIARGLHAVHRAGWLHRDLKPSNILLTDDGQPKLADFGVASLMDSVQSGVVVGSPAFMAPELMRGEAASTASDCYAMAVSLFHLLTGRLPFRRTPAEILAGTCPVVRPPSAVGLLPALPRQWDAFFARALAIEAERRYDTAAAMVSALHDLLPLMRPALPAGQPAPKAAERPEASWRPASWVTALDGPPIP